MESGLAYSSAASVAGRYWSKANSSVWGYSLELMDTEPGNLLKLKSNA